MSRSWAWYGHQLAALAAISGCVLLLILWIPS
jgi:hypothetical protein